MYMEEAIVVKKGEEALDLPPGFRFHPTDEEIITYYLTEKVLNRSFSATAIGEADLNKCEPWDLPKIAKMGEKDQWYFFCRRDRKYPTGMRTNRATESGYWKATGKDKEIYKGKGNLVGMKKTLVFYTGRAPKGDKTSWVMHEFRLEGKFATYTLPKPAKEEWVVCKIFHKTTTPDMFKNAHGPSSIPELLRMNSLGDDLLDCSSLPPLMDPPNFSNTNTDHFKASSSSDAYYCLPINNHKAEAQELEQQVLYQHQHDTNPIPIPNYYSITNDQVNFSAQPQIGTQNPSFCHARNNALSCLSDHNYRKSSPSSGSTNGNVFKMAVKNEYNMSGIGFMEMDKQCSNLEQLSSKSNHSGISNDRNAETSSAVSNQVDDMASINVIRSSNSNNTTTTTAATALYQDLQPPSLGPLSDFECLWDDY